MHIDQKHLAEQLAYATLEPEVVHPTEIPFGAITLHDVSKPGATGTLATQFLMRAFEDSFSRLPSELEVAEFEPQIRGIVDDFFDDASGTTVVPAVRDDIEENRRRVLARLLQLAQADSRS